MRVRLIDHDEPPILLPVGESEFDVRRISQANRREIEAAVRRELRLGARNNDPELYARYLQEVEDRVFDAMIPGWRRLDGDPACTRENKLLLPETVKQAIRAVSESISGAQDPEADAKNSGPPSAG